MRSLRDPWALRRSRLRALVVLVPVLALGLATGGPSVARAAGYCTSGINESWFAGWISSGSPAHIPEGVSATLTYRRAASCQLGLYWNAGYSGWVMVQGLYQPHEYAQAGFFFDGNPLSCIQNFSEYNNNFVLPVRRLIGCVNDGEIHVPKVVYVTGTGGHVRMYVDSTFFDETTFCICNWAQPFQAFYSGEAHDLNGDVPGLARTKTDWNNMQIQYVNVNTWHDVCGNITLYSYVTNSRFATDAVACDHDRSWTATP